jgi:transposase
LQQGRQLLKAVWRDKAGFWLAQKRLEEAKFPWPENGANVQEAISSLLLYE